MRPVLNKADFVERFIAGEFGNRTRVWTDLTSFMDSGYAGLCCLRSRQPGDPRCRYNVPWEGVADCWFPGAYISEMIPANVEQDVVLQGEVCRCPELNLYCSTAKMQMRPAMLQAYTLTNSAAFVALCHAMDASSFEQMMRLLQWYPDHVVEFSCYTKRLGVLDLNTVFWEVRKY